MRILIVEDNNGLCKVLTALLVSAGHEVVGTLTDGSAAVEHVRQLRPDIVCLDYQLPGRDGLSLLTDIQAMAPEIDVLFMTGSDETGIEQRAADAGASGFIRKPFSQKQVIDELRAVIEVRTMASATEAASGTGGDRAEDRDGVAENAVESGTVENTGPEGSAAQRARTAIIADDSGSVRMLLKGLLEESGLRVVQTVSNGSEAITAVRKYRPGVLCLDVNMPVMGGLEALPLLREISPETSVVMVTGCADRNFVTQAAGLGAKGYILKPLRPAYVIACMQKLLA
jgi:DNA-binding NarL/FixJ family response regulator